MGKNEKFWFKNLKWKIVRKLKVFKSLKAQSRIRTYSLKGTKQWYDN